MENIPLALPAKLAYLTEPTPGRVIINLQMEQGMARAILNSNQLANLVSDGARMMGSMMGKVS